jgi:hypothetical protein
VARRSLGRRITVEGLAGYGFLRIPAVAVRAGPAGDPRLAGVALEGHGPTVGASVRLAVAAPVALELSGEGTPVLFGASHEATRVSPRRLAGRAGLAVDCLQLAGARWAAVASYEWSRTTAAGDGVDFAERQQQVGIGLRATWMRRPPPPPAPPPSAPAPPPPPPPAPSAISGVVRAAGGDPVAARVAIPELGLEAPVDATGAFHFDVAPGSYTLTIDAPGFVPQHKPVSARPGEQRIYDVELQMEPHP